MLNNVNECQTPIYKERVAHAKSNFDICYKVVLIFPSDEYNSELLHALKDMLDFL